VDGFHDLGGRQGFGPVVKKDEPFSEDWEVRVIALMGGLVKRRVFNMDEYRHAIERMEPRHYVGASYFERTFTSVAALCVEKAIIKREELDALVGEIVPLSRPSKPGRVADAELPALKIGDLVTVKSEFVGGHIRLPAYIRGMTGRIVGVSPPYPFPDAAGHGLASPKQRTFDVCFKSADLWPNGAEDADVHVGVFHSYLRKAG
jgi:nitrile hydratase subunit beta